MNWIKVLRSGYISTELAGHRWVDFKSDVCLCGITSYDGKLYTIPIYKNEQAKLNRRYHSDDSKTMITFEEISAIDKCGNIMRSIQVDYIKKNMKVI